MITSVRLPHGPATEWDMTRLTLEQLDYERTLAHEALYGHYISGKKVLAGLLEWGADKTSMYSSETYNEAIRVWSLRLKRAEDELFERTMLVPDEA